MLRVCNNIAKRLLIAFFCLVALVAQAKQVTITPVRGSAWFLSVEQLGHLAIQGDSLIVYSNDGSEYGREALTDVRKIEVEQQQETRLKNVKAKDEAIKILEDNLIHIRTHSVEYILR